MSKFTLMDWHYIYEAITLLDSALKGDKDRVDQAADVSDLKYRLETKLKSVTWGPGA